MSDNISKSALFAQFALVAKALGHGHRLELLELLAQGERSVDALAGLAGLTVANASQHLQQLRRAGLVVSRRAGKHVLYRLRDDRTVALMALLREVAERNLAEVSRVIQGYLRRRDDMEPVSRDDLLARMRDGLVIVLDVRPEEEYRAGHLPGAINIPLRELERRLAEIPGEEEVIAYCRGPYCVLAFEAVSLLRARGRRARRLDAGFPEWKAAGLPIEAGNGG